MHSHGMHWQDMHPDMHSFIPPDGRRHKHTQTHTPTVTQNCEGLT